MLKLAQVPEEHREARQDTPSVLHGQRLEHRYYAFLSYSHKDQEIADWLHRELEAFHVPRALQGKLTGMGVIPKQLTPIFRDRHELAAADDLGHEIRAALASSQFLIVLCSPAAANSRWTNAEIEAFKRSRPEGCVLAAIVDGEPFASDVPGYENLECFPPALRHKYDRRGRPTHKRAEPLAADFRENADGKRLGFLKLVAGMLGLALDDLVQRENIRRQRRLAWLAAASLAGMAVTSTLAITAIQARDAARDQRREAEGLVGFMLGDLKDKLEPLGRLDVLDSVGARALAYFQKQDTSQLSDEALAQRSKALTLMGEIANTRGNLDTALRFYHAAYAGTAEALRRDPQNPQRLFDHAQNVFWLGYIDQQQGRLDASAAQFADYRRLANQMINLEPTNSKWRLERAYADNALGVVLMKQHRYEQASATFQEALEASEYLASSEPGNNDYQYRLLEALAWLSDANLNEGRLEDALAQRERQIALLDRWMKERPDDRELSRKAMTAHRAISKLFAMRGDGRAALDHARTASDYADNLVQTEPGNTEWMQYAAASKMNLAALLRTGGDLEGAATALRSGCDLDGRLMAKDHTVRFWKEDLRLQCLGERVRLALANKSPGEAVSIAREATAAANASKFDTPIDAQFWRASTYDLLGNALAAAGDGQQASAAWRAAAANWPTNVALAPEWLAAGAGILRDAGQKAAADQISARLDAMGYRGPESVRSGQSTTGR